jgi:hypothetical protein
MVAKNHSWTLDPKWGEGLSFGLVLFADKVASLNKRQNHSWEHLSGASANRVAKVPS